MISYGCAVPVDGDYNHVSRYQFILFRETGLKRQE